MILQQLHHIRIDTLILFDYGGDSACFHVFSSFSAFISPSNITLKFSVFISFNSQFSIFHTPFNSPSCILHSIFMRKWGRKCSFLHVSMLFTLYSPRQLHLTLPLTDSNQQGKFHFLTHKHNFHRIPHVAFTLPCHFHHPCATPIRFTLLADFPCCRSRFPCRRVALASVLLAYITFTCMSYHAHVIAKQ